MDSLLLLPFQLADYLLDNSLYELLIRRECNAPLGVCPFLDWLLSTEDCLSKIMYSHCSKRSHALVSKKLDLDLVVLGDWVAFPANWLPSISTGAFAKAAAVDNHPRLELLRAPYIQRHTLPCRAIDASIIDSLCARCRVAHGEIALGTRRGTIRRWRR